MAKFSVYTMIIFSSLLILVQPTVGQNLNGSQVLNKIEDSIDANSADIELSMDLYNASGSKRARALIAKIAEANNLTKSYIEFTAPANVEGTAFLAREQDQNNEEMYLFMPALGSVRKIAGSQKNGSFVGTDFTYNDMTILGGGEYKEDYNATVESASSDQYILRLEPTDKEINYEYLKMWVDTNKWFPTKIEFYDSDEKLEKVLTNQNIEQVNGYWTARELTMEDVKKGSRTVLHLDKIAYDVSIDDQIFTTRYLSR